MRGSTPVGGDGVREEDRLPGRGQPAGEGEALARDAADPLSGYRDLFLLPDGPSGPHGPSAIYFAGQSLGLQSVGVQIGGRRGAPWLGPRRDRRHVHDASGRGSPTTTPSASRWRRIVGARPTEVAFLNTLTVNIHLLLTSFFQPVGDAAADPRRRATVPVGPACADEPSRGARTRSCPRPDRRAGRGSVRRRCGRATSRAPSSSTRDELALVFLAGVNFATGQAHDIGRLTAAGRAAGAVVGLGSRPCGGQHRARAPRLGRRLRGVVHVQVPQRRSGFDRRAVRPRAARVATRRVRGWRGGGGPIPTDASTWRDRSSRQTAPPAGKRRRTRCWPSRRSSRRWRSSTRSGCRPCALGPWR